MSLSKMLEDYRNKKREFPTYDELAAIASPEQCADPIIERNVLLLRQRSTVGVQKYGTTLADNKLPLRAWLNHALEEALDQANYLQAAMAEIDADASSLRPTDDHLWDETIRDRDQYHEWADKLAEAISKHFGIDIGEHSNMNCPWHEALEAIENATPAMWAALNMNGKAVCANQDKSACDIERLCIKTPTTIVPLYAGAYEPQ